MQVMQPEQYPIAALVGALTLLILVARAQHWRPDAGAGCRPRA